MGNSTLDDYFDAVYNETINSVSRFVVSKCNGIIQCEDIVQNIYTRFYRRISQKGFTDIENPEAFLINIAKFECKSHFGAAAKDSVVTSFGDYTEEQMVNIENEMSKTDKNLEDTLCNKMLAEQIFKEIAQDSPEIGKIFYLHFVCDMKLEDVAKELDMKLSSVKNKLYRTIEKQRKKYKV